MKMMLESIYEDTFTNTSHGFRPNRSCQTALRQIKINFTGVRWFTEGDIHSYFDMVDQSRIDKHSPQKDIGQSFYRPNLEISKSRTLRK